MPTIAISYRREDTRWIVGRIFDRLVEYYGHDSIFMDIDGVALGCDFRDQIQNTLQRSDVLIAVIGPQWLAIQKETGQPRIADDTDWVRIEIEAALGKKIPVIPVLIDRTPLPKPNELPEALKEFAYRQATNVDTGVDFQSHMDRLIRAIDQLLEREGYALKNASAEERVEQSMNRDRSPFTLIGNIRNGLDGVQRRKMGKISNWRTPLPSLETIAKASGWLSRQANIWLQVVRSPKDFVATIDTTSPTELGKSVQFLFFVLVCTMVLEMPLDALTLHLHVFDPATQIINLFLMACDVVVFSSGIYLFARLMLGKGQYRGTLTAMFYAGALYPFYSLTMYFYFLAGLGLIGSVVLLAVLTYICVKLAPLVKSIHSIGIIRALIALGLAAAVVVYFESVVSIPLTRELIAQTVAK
jgi:hypothetical protein